MSKVYPWRNEVKEVMGNCLHSNPTSNIEDNVPPSKETSDVENNRSNSINVDNKELSTQITKNEIKIVIYKTPNLIN